MSGIDRDVEYELNRLALTLDGNGNPTLAAQAAANVYAQTDSTRDMVGALNVAAGVTDPKAMLDFVGVCNLLAGTSNLDAVSALRAIDTPN